MNKITIFGRIGRDVELKKTNSGKSVCSFSVATTEKYNGNEDTQWHNCVAWEKKAEIISQYFGKGSQILLSGKMTYRQYGEEGNKKTTAEIVISDFSFVDKKTSSSNDNRVHQYDEPPATTGNAMQFPDQEELPF